MGDLKENVEAEFENIELVLAGLPDHSNLQNLSMLELEGTGAILFTFYNGIENILKQILMEVKTDLPEDDSWHNNILNLAVEENIISDECRNNLAQYLAFRNFFRNGYTLNMDANLLQPLVEDHGTAYSTFKTEINNFL